MVSSVPDVLTRIVEHKRAELEALRPMRSQWERKASDCLVNRRDFQTALTARVPAIIAEIKKASPSKGLLASNFDPPRLAATYQAGGAAALSILTDIRFFQGKPEDLVAARAAVRLPVLRKDFILDPVHVIEAAAYGADAILLIAAILSGAEMRELRELAEHYRMAALVEVHNAEELERAIASGARIVGVNNRNLHTFQVTLETSLRLAESIPQGLVRVSESGIHSAGDVRQLRSAGYHAFLVGEHLMKASDPAASLQALIAG